MSDYKFVTIWRVKAPLEKVWNEIYHSEKWPEWWKGVEEVTELEKGDELGVGSIRRYTWKSALPYRLSFNIETVRVEPMKSIEGIARGELAGSGVWSIIERDGYVTARYDWKVETTKSWMNLISPLAKPLFKWNHDVVMKWGAEGLARRLGAAVIDESGS
ncbi:MAG TPA: SRPBCC family protein [Thermodesulfobacteriota bacterium]|nr:SRPBCC family protein [Thermodesulfobacteriota bacterium]